ncbi:MAG: glycoside hydrolase family 65 protein, partial [Candidatus Competibacteraceae bacterium]|nr:glycoside hydrolase family 65 protein [Candidatus Competibacteraceae bacterium]
MSTWALVYEGFEPEKEGLREALCTLGNGYFCTRGAAPEAEADQYHYPGTYLAGGYNRLTTPMAGREVENEDLVNFPNWLPLNFCFNGRWFNPLAFQILDYRQELDLRQGILLRRVRFADQEGRETLLEQRRLVHMNDPHLAALECTVTALNWSGTITVCSALDGRVVNAGVDRYKNLNGKHLQPLETYQTDDETVFLQVQTSQSRLQMAQAARTRLWWDGRLQEVGRRCLTEEGYIRQECQVVLEQGKPLTVEKVVVLYTSRDHAISEAGHAARKVIRRVGGFDQLLRSHILAWKQLWVRFDTHGGGRDSETFQWGSSILRLHIFHLLQSVSLHTSELDVGV